MSRRRSIGRGGFSMIEVLAVMGVIGILAAITLPAVSRVRMRGRDEERIANLNAIRVALELYFEANNYYPQSSCGWDCNGYRNSYDGSWDALANDLAPYIDALPEDPINSTCGPWGTDCYSYAYGNVGRTTNSPQYDLAAQLEDPNHPERCGAKGWRYYFDNRNWCTAFGGSYSNQIYEASP